MSFARNFYCERSPRGYVVAGIHGTDIEVYIDMDPDKKERISSGKPTPENAAQWEVAMDGLAERAEKRVRHAWREKRRKR